jgi:hypothetical protein
MKIDLIKLIAIIWMGFTGFLMYLVYADLSYMTELMHAYIQMIVNHLNH